MLATLSAYRTKNVFENVHSAHACLNPLRIYKLVYCVVETAAKHFKRILSNHIKRER